MMPIVVGGDDPFAANVVLQAEALPLRAAITKHLCPELRVLAPLSTNASLESTS